MPCPEPKDESMKEEHKRLVKESCYFSDIGCGHACTDEVLADYAAKEWASITSSYGQGAIYDASKDDHDESEQVHLASRSVDGEPDIMFD
eukprot:scaffold6280_cov127-Skeletonema_marinoi.AAC.12